MAALVVLTRPAMERDALLAYQDVPFAALVVGAVLLEARRPRARRRRCWSLLARRGPAAAGGVGARRPLRAVDLAAAPHARRARRRRRAGRGRAADLGRLGLGRHRRPAALAARHRRPRDRQRPPPLASPTCPYWTAQYFGYALREPLVLGVPIGLAFAWLHARRRAALPLAVVVAMVAVFAIGPIFGLPLIRRYVAHAGRAARRSSTGSRWPAGRCSPPGPRAHALARRRRRRGAAVGRLPARGTHDLLSTVERRLDRDGVLYGDLQRGDGGAARSRAAFAACPDLTAGDHRPMPVRALLARRRARHGLDRGGRREPDGQAAADAASRARRPAASTRRRCSRRSSRPAGFETIYENRSWRV